MFLRGPAVLRLRHRQLGVLPPVRGGDHDPGSGARHPGRVAARLAEDRPTLFFAGPTFFAALLAADVPAESFASVRLAVSAGEALPAEIHRRFTARHGVDVIDGLGSTEALHIFISNRPGEVRPGTSGTVVPGYEARLLDEEGSPVKDDEPGNLYVRGDSIATGYWCRTATTRQVFQGEWLRTGDTYTRSGDGFYTCLGRSNDMIKAGGIWVSPMEVEARLLQHESVAECAVVAYIDGDGLEKPVACVVPAAGRRVDTGELIAFCRAGLAPSNARARCWCSTSCPRRPPARSSASSSGRSPPTCWGSPGNIGGESHGDPPGRRTSRWPGRSRPPSRADGNGLTCEIPQPQ
ncbi:AMP-binding protein [Streptosporangium lutulentum]